MSKRFIVEGGCRPTTLAGAGARPPPRGARYSAAISPRRTMTRSCRWSSPPSTRRGSGSARRSRSPSARADGRRAGELGPPALRQGTLLPRPRQPGAQAQRRALQRHGPRRGAHARVHPGAARDLGSWQTGAKPSFAGEHYRYTYTTPFFNPGPSQHPRILIAIAAVNPAMCRLAGEPATASACTISARASTSTR